MTEQERANEAAAVMSGEVCRDCAHFRWHASGTPVCVAHVVTVPTGSGFFESSTATFNEPRSLGDKDANRYGCSLFESYRHGARAEAWTIGVDAGCEDTDDDDE